MQSSQPWYGYFAILVFYLFFETFYRTFKGRFWTTHMIEELLNTIRYIEKEIESDNEGARLCAWAVAIVLITSPILILGFGIAGMVKQDSAKDMVLSVVLLVFLVPMSLGLRLFNELCMSWIKKFRGD